MESFSNEKKANRTTGKCKFLQNQRWLLQNWQLRGNTIETVNEPWNRTPLRHFGKSYHKTQRKNSFFRFLKWKLQPTESISLQCMEVPLLSQSNQPKISQSKVPGSFSPYSLSIVFNFKLLHFSENARYAAFSARSVAVISILVITQDELDLLLRRKN